MFFQKHTGNDQNNISTSFDQKDWRSHLGFLRLRARAAPEHHPRAEPPRGPRKSRGLRGTFPGTVKKWDV